MTDNKIRILIDEVFNLFIRTPRGGLVRYKFPNKKEFLWKGSYILELQGWGVWTLHDKEINVAGENIFYLQVDEKKIRDVKEYFQTKNISDEKSKEPIDLSPKMHIPPAWQELKDAERATNDLVKQALENQHHRESLEQQRILATQIDKNTHALNTIATVHQQRDGNKTSVDYPSEFLLTVKDRDIWINNYLIAKPHAVGSNFEFFEYVRSQRANTKIERKNLSVDLQEGLGNKRFFKILNADGFKGEIKKAFFYKVDANSLCYRGDKVTLQRLKEAGINIKLFIKELETADAKYNPD